MPHRARFWTRPAVKFLKSRFINKRKRRKRSVEQDSDTQRSTLSILTSAPLPPVARKHIHLHSESREYMRATPGYTPDKSQGTGSTYQDYLFTANKRPKVSSGLEPRPPLLVPKHFQLICCESTRRPKCLSQCLQSDAKIPYSLVSIVFR